MTGIPYPGGIRAFGPAPLTTPAPAAPFYAVDWAFAPPTPAIQPYFLIDVANTPDPARNDLIARCLNSSTPIISEFVVPLVAYSPAIPLVSPASQVCQSSWNYVNGTARTGPPVSPGPSTGDSFFILTFQWQSA